MNNIILNLSSGISDKENAPKLLSGTGEEKVHLCIVLTSDRGLCGGFNTNIIKKAKVFFQKISDEGKTLKIITVGSKGHDQLKRVYKDNYCRESVFQRFKNYKLSRC
jgi:F-type H+-transporting ATPase subunit gamma